MQSPMNLFEETTVECRIEEALLHSAYRKVRCWCRLESCFRCLFCIKRSPEQKEYDKDFYSATFQTRPKAYNRGEPWRISNGPKSLNKKITLPNITGSINYMFVPPRPPKTRKSSKTKKYVRYAPAMPSVPEYANRDPPAVWVEPAYPNITPGPDRAPAWPGEECGIPRKPPAKKSKLRDLSYEVSHLANFTVEKTMAGTLHVMDALIWFGSQPTSIFCFLSLDLLLFLFSFLFFSFRLSTISLP